MTQIWWNFLFFQLYIHKVWNYRNLGLFPYIFQAGCFALAAYIGSILITLRNFSFWPWKSQCLGITRITDNRHHPTDVLAGSILGTFIAIVAVSCFNLFVCFFISIRNFLDFFSFITLLNRFNDRSIWPISIKTNTQKRKTFDSIFHWVLVNSILFFQIKTSFSSDVLSRWIYVLMNN